MTFSKNKKLICTFLIVSIGLLSILPNLLSVFSSWQNKLTNRLFKETAVNQNIVILALDDKSLEARNGGVDIMKYENLAVLFENLQGLKPKVVAIDYFFNHISNSMPTEDIKNIFSEVIENDLGKKEIGEMFLPYIESPNKYDKELAKSLSGINKLVMAVTVTTFWNSLPFFSDNADVLGNVGVSIDPNDSVVRKYFIKQINSDGETIESLAVAAARLYGSPYTDQIPEIDDQGRMYINYFGGPNSFKQVSAIDVYNGKIDAKEIEGKVVLLGPVSKVFNDLEHTPIAPKQQMPGVEIHANALQTILDGKFLIDAPTAAKAAIIFLMTAVAVGAFMYSSIRVSLAVFLLLWIAYYFGNKLAFDRGVILDQIFPYLALILSLISVYIYRFFTESKEKDFVRTAFSSYVSPDVLKQITDNPEKLHLGGEEKIVTVLFSDIKDSTVIGEGLSAHSLVQLLNEYFSEMSEIVIKNGGTVDKFEGDAIMAVFGAPLGDPNHASLACKTAVEMQSRLKTLRERWKAEGRPELHVRIGINSGPVVAGNVGSKDRFDYTVMGDTVNLGSRLEGANKQYGTQIMVGKNTFDMVQNSEFKDMFTFRFLDKLTVKGKTEAVEVYELGDVSDIYSDGKKV